MTFWMSVTLTHLPENFLIGTDLVQFLSKFTLAAFERGRTQALQHSA